MRARVCERESGRERARGRERAEAREKRRARRARVIIVIGAALHLHAAKLVVVRLGARRADLPDHLDRLRGQ